MSKGQGALCHAEDRAKSTLSFSLCTKFLGALVSQ